MPKNRLPRDYKPNQTFRIELSSDEMNYISSVLPFGYSFVLEPKKSLPKHIIQATKRKNNIQSQDSNSIIVNQSKGEQTNKKIAKITLPNNTKLNNDKNVSHKNVQSSNNIKWIETLSQGLKKSAKILNLLKGHKSSWPFLEPVDAFALQIPQYYEIIKQPMDLQTVQSKLKSDKYADFNQFQSDIMKIIENSYRFNEANEDYLKITSEFQNYFTKLTSDLSQDPTQNKAPNPKNQPTLQSTLSTNKKKKKSSTVTNKQFNELIPVTLLQKKQLVQQMKRLAKQHMKSIKLIVFDHQDEEKDSFDLETLNQKKLRELQKFIRGKIINMEERNRCLLNQKNQLSNLNVIDSEESPFLTSSSADE